MAIDTRDSSGAIPGFRTKTDSDKTTNFFRNSHPGTWFYNEHGNVFCIVACHQLSINTAQNIIVVQPYGTLIQA